MKSPNEETLGQMEELDTSLIDFDPKNRKQHDKEALQSLADSIKSEGLLQPLVVRFNPAKPGRYMLIAGERRFRALQLLKRTRARACVVASADDVSTAKKRLVENMQREDLTPIEEARGYRELAIDHKLTQSEIAKLAGKAQPTVANALRLLDLPAKVQEMVQAGELTRAHGVALARWAKWPKICEAIAGWAIKKGLRSKQLEDDDLPISYELVNAGLVAEIDVNGYGRQAYTVPAVMQNDPDFVKSYSTWYCLVPSKWAPEKKRQDDARAKAETDAKKKDAVAVARGGKTKEQLERAKKIATNKAARSKVAAALESATKRLRAGKSEDIKLAAALVCQKSATRGGDIRKAAEALGVKLPAKFDSYEPASWRSLPVDVAVRLVAQCIVADNAGQALRHAGEVPDEVEFLLKNKGGGK